jgi:hypothetical protein
MKAASRHKPGTRQAIYTKNTYREFHQLLCCLLWGYRVSLRKLCRLKELPTPPTPEILYACINNVLNHLAMLHPLAYSQAIEDHFSILSTTIWTRYTTEEPTTDQDIEDDSDEDLDDDPKDNPDGTDTQRMSPVGSRILILPEVFGRWLQLQMAYFDAMTFMLQLMREGIPENVPVTLEVFTPPHASSQMKP